MMNRKKIFFNIFCFSLFISIIPFSAYAEDNWVLASSAFEFSQSVRRSESETAFASVLPSLIMEQIATGITRFTPADEILDRKYVELLTERQSLILQLSKEIKVRDQVVISNSDSKKIKKLIAAQDEKLLDLQKRIDENLETVKILEEEHVYRTSTETKFNLFKFITKTDVEEEKIEGRNEPVVFYKNSSQALYKVPEPLASVDVIDKRFEAAVLKENINGLVTGVIKTYGDYASVICSLTVFPGAKKQAVVTEVGAMDRPLEIARNIAYRLIPEIINNLPVTLRFAITPQEIRSECKIIIDDVIHSGLEQEIIVNSGFHTVSVECNDYVTQTITYNFINSEYFQIDIPLKKNIQKEIVLCLINPVAGSFFENGNLSGAVGFGNAEIPVTVNGEPVIGQFLTADKGFFFYIPEKLQTDDALTEVTVKAKIQDNAAVIDKRRIWTYRAYSSIVVSLPFTLYFSGKYSTLSKMNSEPNTLSFYQTGYIASSAITGACATFFVYELVRYLVAANSVLPQNVKPASQKVVEKARLDAMLIKEIPADSGMVENNAESEVQDQTEDFEASEKNSENRQP